MTTDVLLNDDAGYYDFAWTTSGDISTVQSLDAYILICLFEEKRAARSEIADPQLRRGWIGNETTADFEQGSKTWQFSQERATGTTLAELGAVVRNALQPLLDDGIAESIDVEQPFLRGGSVSVFINIGRSSSRVERLFYNLWENTGSL